MAQESRIVRVSGLPTDIDEERLIDKLSVHFLRSSNGGGEIDSVTINKKKPDCALVQFEDSGVAQRVIQHGRHTLKVDRKEYKLSVSEHHPSLDPDKVILTLTATVDYSQIPEGRSALARLQQDHPDVEMIGDSSKSLVRLHGAYSKVQSALAQLLAHPQGPGRTSATPIKNPNEGRDERDVHPPSSWEDLPLMVDADVFQYLQERCGREYQHIQSQHGVEVVDVTSEGLTTLFLRVAAEDGEEKQERIKNARKAISSLYQESERNICQAQLRKTDVNPAGGLKLAIESLGVRFPRLLLSDDDCNIYMVGDHSDVSEAKQFLLQEQSQAHEEDVASLMGFPSYPSPATEVHLPSPAIAGPLDERTAPQERRSKGSKAYHLAARLKDPALTPLGNPHLPGSWSPSRQPGLPEGHGSEAASGDSSGHPPMRSKTDSVVRKPSLSATPLPPPRPGSALRRAQSFSGALQQGGPKTDEDPSVCRPRTLRLSPQKDHQGLYHTEMLVSTVMWLHMREAYSTQVEALTPDLHINEEPSDGSVQSTISIRGAEPSAVASCKLHLQELVDAVATDFSVHEIRLSELGVADPGDETLQACCAEVRQRFRKVSVRVMKKSLYLLGSRRLCAQVGVSLREVFSGDVEDKAGGSGSSSASRPFSATCRQINEGHGRLINSGILTKEVRPQNEPRNGSGGQTVTRTDPDQGGPQSATKGHGTDARSEIHGPLEGICVCGESGASTTRTECGAVMCPECLDAVHVHCRVCRRSAAKTTAPAAIRGKMSHCKLNFSLPGHNKHATIKITYRIPAGLQEKEHPSPGKPFQGDVFEAFLPDCEKSRKLLPRLEDAFRRGLTFTVTGEEKGSKVTWDAIPHKTSLQGGRSGNGYPDSSYLKRLSDVLTSLGIEEEADKA
uniref:uncharacterized protein si:busm1-163l24.3 n=1 Tax=Doryrhamphus excisus TaxID=161450 RepID=UPI0025ADEB3D|nr:uncharacterized protein si:busm1-163l24.3 [Doryrhamphus excisus]XP_057904136.1 uncharacterized protein si:busm1-163l24.3 [Doryrhamphus excisus]XP_057904137.1 uncharacterized protein si:busm1-163l24.3 [Doryrhamphus excisus]